MPSSLTIRIFKQMIGLCVVLMVLEQFCQVNSHKEISPSVKVQPDTFRSEALARMNTIRAMHGSPPVTLNKTICDLADTWAKTLGDISEKENKVTLSHHPNMTSHGGIGNNIYACKCSSVTAAEVTDLWHSESKFYNYTASAFMPKAAQFTQLIWKDTQNFCISKYVTPKKSLIVVVALYYPRGNMHYQASFKRNVLPPIPGMITGDHMGHEAASKPLAASL